LNIFFSRSKAHSTSFLTDAYFIEKNRCLFCWGTRTPFTNTPGGIYTIGEIVSHMVLMTINSE
jgi:hypothetical protein